MEIGEVSLERSIFSLSKKYRTTCFEGEVLFLMPTVSPKSMFYLSDSAWICRCVFLQVRLLVSISMMINEVSIFNISAGFSYVNFHSVA